MYDEYNERLLKAGLLQNLKYEACKNPEYTTTTAQNRPAITTQYRQSPLPLASIQTAATSPWAMKLIRQHS